jgi:hypothetical protein
MAFRLCRFVFGSIWKARRGYQRVNIIGFPVSIWVGGLYQPNKNIRVWKEVLIVYDCLGALFLRGHILPAIVLYQLNLIFVYGIVTAVLHLESSAL